MDIGFAPSSGGELGALLRGGLRLDGLFSHGRLRKIQNAAAGAQRVTEPGRTAACRPSCVNLARAIDQHQSRSFALRACTKLGQSGHGLELGGGQGLR